MESHKNHFLYSTFSPLYTAFSSTSVTHSVFLNIFLSFASHHTLLLLSVDFTRRFPENCSVYAKLQIQSTFFSLISTS